MATQERTTLDQAVAILRLIQDKGTSQEQVTRLLSSGYLSDLLEAELDQAFDRNTFRKWLGLRVLPVPISLENTQRTTYRCAFDYDEPLSVKMGKVRGFRPEHFQKEYGWFDGVFTKSVGSGQIEMEAVIIGVRETQDENGEWIRVEFDTSEVLSLLDSLDLRAAIPKELADVAKSVVEKWRSDPDYEKGFLLQSPIRLPLIALGDSGLIQESYSSRRAKRYVMTIGGSSSTNTLHLGVEPISTKWAAGRWFLAFPK